MADAEARDREQERHRQSTLRFVRQIIVLVVGVLMIAWSLIDGDPAVLMGGTALVGGTPIDAAKPRD